jgi:hypothetical protein
MMDLQSNRGARLRKSVNASALRLNNSAHALRVQFAPFEKSENLVCGQRKISAHREDYLSIGGLHRETHSHSMLTQQVDGSRNIVCSRWVIAHDKHPKPTSLPKCRKPV